MSGIAEIIEQFNEGASATVDIPVDQGEAQRLNCILRKTQAPSFKLLFPPYTFTDREVEPGTSCRLIVKHGEGAVNLNVRMDEKLDDRTLHFTALESINPESLREYFRVMISVPVEASYQPGVRELRSKPWKLNGQTIDLSGGGVLALFPDKPANKRRIQLAMELPGQIEPILCTASVVRTYRMRKNRYQVAFHIEEIEPRARDNIISCCLQEQRRQLRDKVRVE